MKPARELLKTPRSRFVIRANQLSRNLPPCVLRCYTRFTYTPRSLEISNAMMEEAQLLSLPVNDLAG